MLFKISWLNIWRNPVRSGVVIASIALGLLAGVFASAFVNGMMDQKLKNVIDKEMSHFQFHENEFRDEFDSKLYMSNDAKIVSKLKADERVKMISSRCISMVMMGTANFNGGVKAVGVNPEDEGAITGLSSKVVEGKYFEGARRNPILISKRQAEKFHVKLKSKVVLTMQDMDGEITAAAFRVVGIFDTKNGLYDELNVFVRKSDLQRIIGMEEGAHEIAVMLHENDAAETVAKEYAETYGDLEVLPWMDLAVGMRYMMEAMGQYTLWLVGIIMVALLFGIVNTMLMAIMERIREIGMLMAVGMSRARIFFMIMLETVMLSFIGGPVGLFISWVLIGYFGRTGIDLSGANYEDMGFSNMIYPMLPMNDYLVVTVMVIFMAMFASIFPAIKALKLRPAEAVRKI